MFVGETGTMSFNRIENLENSPTRTFKTGLFHQVTQTFRVGADEE